MSKSHDIRTERRPACHLCGTKGEYLYRDLEDRLFGVPGRWSIRKCSNTACGLLWLDPMPAQSDLVKLYVRYYTHTYTHSENSKNKSVWKLFIYNVYEGYWNLRYGYMEREKSWVDKLFGFMIYIHPGRRAHLDGAVMFLNAKVDGKLLEIGCGNGDKLAHMKKFGWDVEGVDFDSTAVEIARHRGLKVRLGELEEQGYPENSFDAIVSSHVLEHVPDPRGFLRECYRLLKPGGQLAFATPNARSYGHQIYRCHWRGLEPPRHLHLFTEDSLRYVTQIAEFQNIRCHTTGRGGRALFASHMLKKHGAFSPDNLTLWNKLERLMFHYVEYLIVRINGRLGTELLVRAEK